MGANHTKEQSSSSQEIHHHDPMGSQLFINSNIINASNLNNQMINNQLMYPYNSDNDLNDNMTKSMKQQIKIASIGVNKSVKNKFKTNSNQNINTIIDPNGLYF